MKLTLLFLISAVLGVHANGLSQTITLSGKEVKLKQVFTAIEKQTGYVVIYNRDHLESARPVSFSVTDMPLTNFLELILKGQPFSYRLEGRTISLSRKTVPTTSIPDQGSGNQGSAENAAVDLSGKVTGTDGKPLQGATVAIKNSRYSTLTNAEGVFTLKVNEGDVLLISYVGYETYSVTVTAVMLSSGNTPVIALKPSVIGLEEVEVTMSTGYFRVPKERATGSFNHVNTELFNRSVSTNVLDRIENLTPGLLFNKGDAAQTDPILIRGRSTLFANASPLIVVDNFPYDGDLGNINPNDIASVTVLKDAAAASIWGARAGNGVIVITTKRGTTAKPRVEFNSNVTIRSRPNLRNISTISSADYIDVERYLFQNFHYFNDEFYDQIGFGHPPLTPVVELLIKQRDGLIDSLDAERQIEAFRQNDVRDDLKKYLYQTTVNQQYALNVSGSTPYVNYYMSAGYDKNLQSLVGSDFERLSLRSLNTFKIAKGLEADIGVNFLSSVNQSGYNLGATYNSSAAKRFYPYAKLVDNAGNALPVYTDYRQSFIESAHSNGLLNWEYKPVDDISNAAYTTKIRDYLVNAAIRYQIIPGLNAEFRYQFENQIRNNDEWQKEHSYFARDLVNTFTQVNVANGALSFPVPRGGILSTYQNELLSHQGRAQLNFNHTWNNIHEVTALAGYEIRSIVTNGNSNRMYGYDPEISLAANQIDFTQDYFTYSNQYFTRKIDNIESVSRLTDHFLSYFGNAAYQYRRKYILSASLRKDEANLFGVAANQKGTPLWSAGAAWIASEERFLNVSWLSFLKLKASYGVNGNISRLASALPTAFYANSTLTNNRVLYMSSPPNESLSWEKIRTTNIGLDFSIKKDIVTGSIEFYTKRSNNLLGQAPVDPTYGLSHNPGESYFYGNVAGIKGRGMDIEITSRTIDRKNFKWTTTFLFSRSVSEVTKYLMPQSSVGNTYLTPSSIFVNPIIGKPVFSIFSYQWAGLDPSNGDPMGYANGQKSSNWNTIYTTTPLDSMVYHGSAQPQTYGALRTTVSWKSLSFSLNISYKFDYYFRKTALSYGELYDSWTGHGEYADRWQQPGDELKTNVPSRVYPNVVNRDNFYRYAAINVLKGDHIRLEDVTVSYDFNKADFNKLPFQNCRLYFYASNLGVIWKANKEGIDPYFNNTVMNRPGFSFGLNVKF